MADTGQPLIGLHLRSFTLVDIGGYATAAYLFY